jgi:hypothetical protein
MASMGTWLRQSCVLSSFRVDLLEPEPLHTDAETTNVPKFERFLQLPAELPARIYEAALYTGLAIRPHLYNFQHDGAIEFHDDSLARLPPDHGAGAITKLLGITLVSKAVRAKSLPFFYFTNTFHIVADTPTYFAHLRNLGRFHLIRHVSFTFAGPLDKALAGIFEYISQFRPIRRVNPTCIELRDNPAAEILEQMTTYVKDVESYERVHPPLSSSSNKRPRTESSALLKLLRHPRYNASSLQMILFICLRMLTSTLPKPTSTHTSSLVLSFPSAQMSTADPRLRWISAVCTGLGINVRFLEDHAVSHCSTGDVSIVWHRKFQKKEFGSIDTGAGEEGTGDGPGCKHESRVEGL